MLFACSGGESDSAGQPSKIAPHSQRAVIADEPGDITIRLTVQTLADAPAYGLEAGDTFEVEYTYPSDATGVHVPIGYAESYVFPSSYRPKVFIGGNELVGAYGTPLGIFVHDESVARYCYSLMYSLYGMYAGCDRLAVSNDCEWISPSGTTCEPPVEGATTFRWWYVAPELLPGTALPQVEFTLDPSVINEFSLTSAVGTVIGKVISMTRVLPDTGAHVKHQYECATCHDSQSTAFQFDTVTKTCSNVSCHSVPAGTYTYWTWDWGSDSLMEQSVSYGSSPTTPSWYATDVNKCTLCHPFPAYYTWHGHHGPYNDCQTCHPDAASTNGGQDAYLTNASMHRDRRVQVSPRWRSSCFNCH